jgi:hypothetical protein
VGAHPAAQSYLYIYFVVFVFCVFASTRIPFTFLLKQTAEKKQLTHFIDFPKLNLNYCGRTWNRLVVIVLNVLFFLNVPGARMGLGGRMDCCGQFVKYSMFVSNFIIFVSQD